VLDALDRWPVERAAAAVVTAAGVAERHGDTRLVQPVASVTKLLVAYAALLAVEEGTLSLEDQAGPPGSTVRHLLAHASGLPFEGATPIARPGTRRVYSNTGFEVLGATLERAAAMPLGTYLDEGVLAPLGMRGTELRGSPASGAWSCVDDLARFSRELLSPTLISAATLDDATRPQLGALPGVVPGIGQFEDNAWGLGFELHGTKAPHWMPPHASARAFGHFGASGAFVWVDPAADVACSCITDRDFGEWALASWPALGEAILGRAAHSGDGR
jgi:CubicO group peptidase (beta-lactamase class C family)